jgi:hypothetical protein
MELTSDLMDIVENTNWDDDGRQDFYIKWLEKEGSMSFDSKSDLKRYIMAFYKNGMMHRARTETNRRRIEKENQEAITRELGLDGQAADPCDLLMIGEEYEDIVTQLSPLIRRAYESVVINGESVEDVAVGGRTTPNVIYQRVHEAKRIIKEGINNG